MISPVRNLDQKGGVFVVWALFLPITTALIIFAFLTVVSLAVIVFHPIYTSNIAKISNGNLNTFREEYQNSEMSLFCPSNRLVTEIKSFASSPRNYQIIVATCNFPIMVDFGIVAGGDIGIPAKAFWRLQ